MLFFTLATVIFEVEIQWMASDLMLIVTNSKSYYCVVCLYLVHYYYILCLMVLQLYCFFSITEVICF
jgi:hypothetical protein